MKEAKEYYNISILDGMLVSNEESVIEAIQMVIDDAGKEKELELLDVEDVNDVIPDWHLHNELETFSEYLKAKNLFIVKINDNDKNNC